jgi:alpha-galactosidase
LADYVHERGLKLGIYTDVGRKTCMAAGHVDPQEKISNHEGSLGHEYEDAKQYAEWGIDHVKNDFCFSKGLNPKQIYAKFADAIRASGRPMVYNLCGWGEIEAHKWGASIGAQSWRIGPDIENNWKSVLLILDMSDGLEGYAGPGGWNDPDMLEVGNGFLTEAEEKAHFSLWSILAAPLIAGNDLRKMSKRTIKILTAKEVIAVDQDPLGMQGKRISKSPNEVWAKPLSDGSRAVVLFNRSDRLARISVNWKDIWLKPGNAKVRDLWARSELGEHQNKFSSIVEPHGVVMVKISGDPEANPVYDLK